MSESIKTFGSPEKYREYLNSLDEEFLLYEFNDRFGCEPFGYFINAIKAEAREHWVAVLMDNFEVNIFENQKKEKEGLQNDNKPNG
jgi:hypothetical protein